MSRVGPHIDGAVATAKAAQQITGKSGFGSISEALMAVEDWIGDCVDRARPIHYDAMVLAFVNDEGPDPEHYLADAKEEALEIAMASVKAVGLDVLEVREFPQNPFGLMMRTRHG